SRELNIDLPSKEETEYFKWFLACLLFGKPIQQEVAKRTFFAFMDAGLDNPDAIMEAGWDKLVEVLGKGRYVRYDFSTAGKLLSVSQALKGKYGSITEMIKAKPRTMKGLYNRMLEFKGVGPVTAGIFIRDMVPALFPKKRKTKEPEIHDETVREEAAKRVLEAETADR
ncbi:hypothetical protein HY419_01475, partial [candidate division WWE3 bacterium]|nr:hypothetical protein [candidate division WWE3 bacterium]